MRLRFAGPITLITLALALGALAGCGGSSSGTTGSSSSSSGGTEGTTASSGESSGSESSNAAGSSQPAEGFSKKARQAKFGEEAPSAEREEASKVLEENLSARASGDYAVQCETLAALVIRGIEKNGKTAVGKRGCPETLESEAKKAPPPLLENTMEGPIAALRKQGNLAYALYHGKKEADYAMRMLLENGEWKVAATLTEGMPSN